MPNLYKRIGAGLILFSITNGENPALYLVENGQLAAAVADK